MTNVVMDQAMLYVNKRNFEFYKLEGPEIV